MSELGFFSVGFEVRALCPRQFRELGSAQLVYGWSSTGKLSFSSTGAGERLEAGGSQSLDRQSPA